ncbi:DUF1097 domain-containing protein [Streptomyces sp. NPDC001292]|uniref:DUF1097 domain-containing protein n=1 Tax=Streptomyces sp. NPDC001292 TaxID=3364558 RepID=UPI0036823357
MRPLIATGITVGFLAGLWAWTSDQLGAPTWVAVVSWAAFFAADGKAAGLVKTAASTLSGVAWGWLSVLAAGLATRWSGALPVAVAVAVIAFAMCAQASWTLLSFIPGAFLGAAALFGNAGDVPVTAAVLVVGVLLGIASERSADLLVRSTTRESDTESGAVPA